MPHTCETCKYSTDRKLNIDRHMLSKKHLMNVELKEDQNKSKSDFKKTHKCDICNWETTSTSNLKRHLGSEKHIEMKFEKDFRDVNYLKQKIKDFEVLITKAKKNMENLEKAGYKDKDQYRSEELKIERFTDALKRHKLQLKNIRGPNNEAISKKLIKAQSFLV